MKLIVRLTALVCVAWLVGCGSGGPPPNTLLYGNGTEPKDLDPHVVTGVTEHRILNAMYEGLVNLDMETLEPVPGVADSWSVSGDGLTYTFHLREDARWSNGDPVTAEDFRFAYERILTPAMAAEYAYMLFCIENAEAYNKGDIDDFGQVGVTVVDPRTLVITLNHPTPYFLSMQTHQTYFPVHRPTLAEYGAEKTRGQPWTRAGRHVSNGPFRLAEWRPSQDMSLTRNPHYWGADQVQLDGIIFYPVDDILTEERMFQTGKLHVTETVPSRKIEGYRKDHPELLQIHPYYGSYYYRVNVTRPPFDDVRVRRAFQMTVDREAIAQHVLKAGEAPASSYVPPHAAAYAPRYTVPFDPDAARALLADAGYPDGEGLPPVEILYNTSDDHKRIAEAIQQMWREHLGVTVGLLNQDWKVYLNSMNTLDYSLARSGWIGDVLDPINFLECFLTGTGNNRTGYSSEAYDKLIHAIYAEADEAARLELMQKAEAMLLEAAPVIPIYFYTRKYLQRPFVHGLTPNPLGLIDFRHVRLDNAEATG